MAKKKQPEKVEQPVRVEPFQEKGHRMETRVFVREIHQYWCVDPTCRFNGQPAQQGVCHSKLGRPAAAYLGRVERDAEKMVASLRETEKPKDVIKVLASHLVCTTMNYDFLLDEVVKLRAEVGTLRLEAKKKGKKR